MKPRIGLCGLLVCSVISLPCVSDERRCEYIQSDSGSDLGFDRQGCQEGDALRIYISSKNSLAYSREYLSMRVSELCDTKYPITVLPPVEGTTSYYAVCRYVGKVRQQRARR